MLATRQFVEPAGTTIAFDGRPLDLVPAPDGRFVFVKEQDGVITIDAPSGAIASRFRLEKLGASMHGIAITRAGDKLYVTGTEDQLVELAVAPDGNLRVSRTLVLPPAEVGDDPYPCGVALAADEASACVCLSRGNALAIVDLREGKTVATIPVGVAPYDVVLSPDGRLAYVSNFGGRRAQPADRTAPSSGTPLVVDERGVGASGTISVVDLAARTSLAEIGCGLHPCDLELSRDGTRLFAAAANSDAVFVIDTRTQRIVEEISVRPDPALTCGSRTGSGRSSAAWSIPCPTRRCPSAASRTQSRSRPTRRRSTRPTAATTRSRSCGSRAGARAGSRASSRPAPFPARSQYSAGACSSPT